MKKDNDPFSKKNTKEYNDMPKNLDPTGIFSDETYVEGMNEGPKKEALKKRLHKNERGYMEYR